MVKSVKDILLDGFWIMPATPEYIQNGVPYITSKNIKNGKIDFSKANYISKDAYAAISKNRPILVGDILISMIGTLGETAEVTVEDGNFYGQNMFLIRLNEKEVNKRYFLNYFKSDFVKRSLASKQNQSTQKYLKANHIEDLQIPVLPLKKQQSIAETLDTIERIIISRKEELFRLDELIKARFVELFDSIDNCKISKFSDECEEITAGGDRPKDTSEIRTEDYQYPVFANAATNEGLLCFSREYKIEKPCVTIAARGCTVGFTAIRYEKFTPVVRLISLVPKETVTPIYLKYYIDIKMNIEGNGAAQPQLTIPMIKSMEIMVPPIELQNQFAAFVEQTDKSKVVVQKALDEAQLLFDSLMQKYFG